MRERKKLEEEERQAEEALELAMARLARVRKQKRSLKEKGEELVVRGIRSLEESGELRSESLAVSQAQSLGAVDLIDWDAVWGRDVLDPRLLGSGVAASGVPGESSSEGVEHG